MSKTVANYKNEGPVTIESSNGSGNYVFTTYVTSANELKVARELVGIDDEVTIGENTFQSDSIASSPVAGYSRTLSNFLEPVYSSATSGVTAGKYVSDAGVETTSVTYSISPYYYAPGKKFVLLNELNSYPAQRGVIYDQNKNYMVSIVSQRPSTQTASTFILSAVSGDSSATYFRFNYLHNTTLPHMLYVGIERDTPTVGFKKLSFMGDSITHGTYTYALSGGFASAVCSILKCEMQNLGSPGNKMTGTGGMVTRISGCDQNADAVVLMGGYNDYLASVALGPTSSTNINEFYGTLNSICNYFTSARIWQKLYICTPTRSFNTSANAQGLQLSSYADAIKLKASEYGISLIDCYYDSALEPKISAAWRSLYFPDGLHPSWWGDYMLGSFIAQKLISN